MMNMPMVDIKKAIVGSANAQSATYLVRSLVKGRPAACHCLELASSPIMPMFLVVLALISGKALTVECPTGVKFNGLI